MTEASESPEPGLATRRSAWRTDFLARRASLEPRARASADAAIAAHLDILLAGIDGVLAFYWPIRAEFDARAAVTAWLAAGSGRRACLPIVVKREAPLLFREWTPASNMRTAGFGTSVPADGAELVPTALLIPLVGFDTAGYRLGYGGGYYDRTLGAMTQRPLCIGIGHACCRLPDIEPQTHDVRMDMIVTDDGVLRLA